MTTRVFDCGSIDGDLRALRALVAVMARAIVRSRDSVAWWRSARFAFLLATAIGFAACALHVVREDTDSSLKPLVLLGLVGVAAGHLLDCVLSEVTRHYNAAVHAESQVRKRVQDAYVAITWSQS